jgi:hypothetical protein
MKFMKGFKLGKSKDKDKETAAVAEKAAEAKATAAPAAEAAAKPKDEELAPPRPHGPLGELSVDADDTMGDATFDDEDVDISSITDGDEPTVKVQELNKPAEEATPEAEAEKPPETKAENPPEAKAEKPPEAKTADEGDSFSSLFTQDDEEENPLANLIASMPDISAGELLDDLKEIKGIMKEGRK